MEIIEDHWMIDCILANHMCSSLEQLENANVTKNEIIITNAIHGEFKTTGTANGELTDRDCKKLLINNISIVPGLKKNILSISQLLNEGYNIEFKTDHCTIKGPNGSNNVCMATPTGYEMVTTRHTQHKAKNETKLEENNGQSDDTSQYQIIKEEPENWKDVMKLSNQEIRLWTEAMHEEMAAMRENKVWSIQQPPENTKPIDCRWTYSIKKNHKGRIVKLKARLVAKGCHQIFGQNYDQTYAPVVRQETIRTLICLAGSHGMKTRHCDISSAFLYGEIDEVIYMRGPPGPWEDPKDITLLLHKSIYGLKQAARIWHQKIHASLTGCGYIPSTADQCLYIGDSTFVLIHVDDLLLISHYEHIIDKTVAKLALEYKIKDLGPVKCYLGIVMEYDEQLSCYNIHQRPKIEKLIKQFLPDDCYPTPIPMEPGFLKGSYCSTSPKLKSNIDFQKVVGSLMYLGLVSRPDIHLAANLLGRKASEPTEMDWTGTKKVLRYLKGSINHSLRLGGKVPLTLSSFCDADWGGDVHSRKSTSGQIHFLGTSAISWKAKKQSCIALSTAEAEYVAAAHCVQELIWLQRLVEDLGMTQTLPTILYTDSMSGIKMASSQKLSNRTKHVDLKYYFLRDYVDKGVVDMQYRHTSTQIADLFTKPLPKSTFNNHIMSMGMIMND